MTEAAPSAQAPMTPAADATRTVILTVDSSTGKTRLNGLALMALGAGCGLAPGELRQVRGHHVDTASGVPVLDKDLLGQLVACRAGWAPVLVELV